MPSDYVTKETCDAKHAAYETWRVDLTSWVNKLEEKIDKFGNKLDKISWSLWLLLAAQVIAIFWDKR